MLTAATATRVTRAAVTRMLAGLCMGWFVWVLVIDFGLIAK